MKTTTSGYVFNWVTSLIMAMAIVILAAMTTAKAQKSIEPNNIDLNTINGLFTPTESQRFFQAGREDFAREVRIFLHPERYLKDDILQIDPELRQQMYQQRPTANFLAENAQYQLDSSQIITNN